jgi:hypothetical protein
MLSSQELAREGGRTWSMFHPPPASTTKGEDWDVPVQPFSMGSWRVVSKGEKGHMVDNVVLDILFCHCQFFLSSSSPPSWTLAARLSEVFVLSLLLFVHSMYTHLFTTPAVSPRIVLKSGKKTIAYQTTADKIALYT